MKVIIDVCQNTDLVELLSFAKSREMCVVGFPDNPEMNFLRSEVPHAANWCTPGKTVKRSAFWERRKRPKKSRMPPHSSTSASEDEYYFASESGSPLNTPRKNGCNSKSMKWRKGKQAIPAENKAMCTKCGSLITSSRIFALINHASAHSSFPRYKCSACDFHHKSFIKVRTHIHLEHDGDPSIKQQDQMNDVERLRIRQIAHECFPSYIANPNTPIDNVPVNADHSVETAQEDCETAPVLECPAASPPSNIKKGKERRDAVHFKVNAEFLCLFESALNQSNTSSSDDSSSIFGLENKKPEYDSDCIILE